MNDMINVRMPMYIPVRLKEKHAWAKDISERNKRIHDLVELAFKTGWKYCFDLPAVVTGIVCSIVPENKIGNGLIELNEKQSTEFYMSFVLTTNEIIGILENSDFFQKKGELIDLLFGRTILTNDGPIHMENEEEKDD